MTKPLVPVNAFVIGRGLIGQNHSNCKLPGLLLRERGSLLNATNLHWYASNCGWCEVIMLVD